MLDNAGPLPARLTLTADSTADPTARTMLDGAWWPRSRDAGSEITALLTALAKRNLTVDRVMINPTGWPEHPRRVQIAGRVVKVGWFETLEESLLIATSYPDHRLDLLIVAPDAEASVAERTMSLAANGSPTAKATAVRAAGEELKLRPEGAPALAAWEDEGGHLNGRVSKVGRR